MIVLRRIFANTMTGSNLVEGRQDVEPGKELLRPEHHRRLIDG